MIEELRALIFIPAAAAVADRAARGELSGDKLLDRLRRAIGQLVAATPALTQIRVRA